MAAAVEDELEADAPFSELTRTDDEVFDEMLHPYLRSRSPKFWTPFSVARRAGELLAVLGVGRVLDVGSGPGKFCIAAATAAPKVQFVGVEQRKPLVSTARQIATRLGVTNVEFEVGDATLSELTSFDAVYFFNPFAENSFEARDRLDQTVELTEARRLRDVAHIERALARTKIGTLVLTYHTFGGRFPDTFTLFHSERSGTDWLRIWRKTRTVATPSRYHEEDENRRVVTCAAAGRSNGKKA
ncbi:MAG: methyltransferase domain-containing protein [Polyangiales bacterium]